MSVVRDSSVNEDEDELIRWFTLLKDIKNGPDGGYSKDISEGLRDDIEKHFRYFWENHRNSVFLKNMGYFNSIPFVMKEQLLCNFMFKDILNKNAF